MLFLTPPRSVVLNLSVADVLSLFYKCSQVLLSPKVTCMLNEHHAFLRITPDPVDL